MSTADTNGLNPLESGQVKDKDFDNHKSIISEALKHRSMTMKEIDVYTGIMRESVCRHLKVLRENGIVGVIGKRKCTITGYAEVMEFSADKSLFAISNQLKLF